MSASQYRSQVERKRKQRVDAEKKAGEFRAKESKKRAEAAKARTARLLVRKLRAIRLQIARLEKPTGVRRLLSLLVKKQLGGKREPRATQRKKLQFNRNWRVLNARNLMQLKGHKDVRNSRLK